MADKTLETIKALSYEDKVQLLNSLKEDISKERQSREKEEIKRTLCDLIDKGELTVRTESFKWPGFWFRQFMW